MTAVIAASLGLTGLASWSAPLAGHAATVDIYASGLDTSQLVVNSGMTVTFINHLDTPVRLLNGNSTTAVIPAHGSASRLFARSGSYHYELIHGGSVLGLNLTVIPHANLGANVSTGPVATPLGATPHGSVAVNAAPGVRVLGARYPSNTAAVSNLSPGQVALNQNLYGSATLTGTNLPDNPYSVLDSTIPGTNLRVDPNDVAATPGVVNQINTTSAGPMASPAVPGSSFAGTVSSVPAPVTAGPLASPAAPGSSYASNPEVPVQPMLGTAGGVASISQFGGFYGYGYGYGPYGYGFGLPNTYGTLGTNAVTTGVAGLSPGMGTALTTGIPSTLTTNTSGVINNASTVSVLAPNFITTQPPGENNGTVLNPLGVQTFTATSPIIGSVGVGSNVTSPTVVPGTGIPASTAYGPAGAGVFPGTISPVGPGAGPGTLGTIPPGSAVGPAGSGLLAGTVQAANTSAYPGTTDAVGNVLPPSTTSSTNELTGPGTVSVTVPGQANQTTLTTGPSNVTAMNGEVAPGTGNGTTTIGTTTTAVAPVPTYSYPTTGNGTYATPSMTVVQPTVVTTAPGYTTTPGSPAMTPSGVNVTTSAPSIALANANAVVDLDLASPSDLMVTAGTTVTFLDRRGGHSVRALDGSFHSARLHAGQAFRHKFNRAGRYRYKTSSGRIGTIDVAPAAR